MRKIITTAAVAAVAVACTLTATASASTGRTTVVKQTVTIASCTGSAQSGGSASCFVPPVGHRMPFAYKVFSMQVHVKSSPGGQPVIPVELDEGCTGPAQSHVPPPAASLQLGWPSRVGGESDTAPGSTPFESGQLATPYQRFCVAGASATVGQGSIHVWITAVIQKGAKHSSP
jgi:hypothetical protein